MLGAIVGDVVGSRFEFKNHRSKQFDLFAKGCFATDDSIMTLAVAKAILEADKAHPLRNDRNGAEYHKTLAQKTVQYMQQIGRHYPACGYGISFYRWVFSDTPQPYNSFGNGAAMRVSPSAFAAHSLEEALGLAHTVTAVTHNHPEGIKGAKAITAAIFLAQQGATKTQIKSHIEERYYPLQFSIDQLRPAYMFNETCQQTVPQAIQCFLEATSFEDAIRTAISLGGDSDTIAAITGAIAEAYYSVPSDIAETALGYLDKRLLDIYVEWESVFQKKRYNSVTACK